MINESQCLTDIMCNRGTRVGRRRKEMATKLVDCFYDVCTNLGCLTITPWCLKFIILLPSNCLNDKLLDGIYFLKLQ